jgi:hypothetical protein
MVVTTVLTGRVSSADRIPVPGKQVADALLLHAGQYIGEPSLWIDVVELGGLCDEGVDRSRAVAALIGAGEGPISSSDRDGP